MLQMKAKRVNMLKILHKFNITADGHIGGLFAVSAVSLRLNRIPKFMLCQCIKLLYMYIIMLITHISIYYY